MTSNAGTKKSKWITVSRKDPQFDSLITGSFSKVQRALPVPSVAGEGLVDLQTFHLVDREQLRPLRWSSAAARVLRLQNLPLVLFPLCFVLLKLEVDAVPYDGLLAILCAVGSMFVYVSMNLRNDFQDHYWGLDLQKPDRELGLIQAGAWSAGQVRMASRVFLVLGFLLGAPSLVLFWPELLGLAVISLLILFATGLAKLGIRYRLGTELASFLLPGPCLVAGYQIAIGAGWDLETLALGLIAGGLSLLVFYLRSFELLVPSTKADLRNSIVRRGFERGRDWILVIWAAWGFLVSAYSILYGGGWWRVVIPVSVVLVWFRVRQGFLRVPSPVGSRLGIFARTARGWLWIVASLVLMQLLTSLLISLFAGEVP